MKVYSITDIGRVRPINEDSCYAPQPGEQFCAVADGMGGHNAGEVASAMAVKVFSEYMRDVQVLTPEALRASVARANDAIFRASQESEQVSGMGTTFSALAMRGANAFIAHVGDSRIYLIRHGAIMQVTMDHTLVAEMVLKGLITVREARVHPRRNIITRALGTDPRVEIDILQLELRRGDVFFMCTDGMTNHVPEREILHVTLSAADWDSKLRRLVGTALNNGGSDNITAMYAIYEEANG